jgi:transcriptional regulator with XRE-family HTH domain
MARSALENKNPAVPAQDDAETVRAIGLGRRVRLARLARGMSIDDVAQASGMSKSFLSRFERDIAQASIASLLRLCEAVGIAPATLFEPPETSFVAAGRGAPINLGGVGMSETIISGMRNEHLLALHSVIRPGGGSGDEAYALKASADLVHVKSGALEITVGDETYRVAAGDTLTFKPSIPHTWRNPSKTEDCTAIWVIVPPLA